MQSLRQPMQMTHNDMRFTEQSLLSDLSAKYGVDSSQRDARQPTALRGVVEYQFTNDQPSSPAEGKKKAQGAAVALTGGELLSQMILAHLEIFRCTHAADTLRQEMRSFGLDESYYVASQSPINFLAAQAALPLSVLALTGEQTSSAHRRGDTAANGRNDGIANSRAAKGNVTSESPIAMLLTPHTVTRECIGRLLSKTAQDIIAHCSSGEEMSDVSIVKHLTEAIEQPIWSEAPGDALLLRRHPASSKIIAATLNQLVEELTCVFYNPIASRTAQTQQNDDAFVASFLLTYKNFCTPKGLLAKLMQRCFVPSSLEVGDLFEGAGIRFYAPNGMMATVRLGGKGGGAYGKRTTAWLMITQLVQVRVLSVLAVWLRDFPHHFDVSMLQSILLFLEEVCYQPTSYTDCPAKLMQCAEFVKGHAARILSGRAHTTTSSFDPPTLQALDGYVVASGATGSPTPNSAVDVIVRSLEVYQRDSGSLLAALLSGGDEGGQSSFGGRQHGRGAEAMDTASRTLIDEFLRLPVQGIAVYVSACSNLLFREVKVDAIQFVAVSGSVQRSNGHKGVRMASMGITSSNGTSTTQQAVHGDDELRNFFAHAERLMTWTAGMCLSAASADVQKGSTKGSKFPLLEGVVHHFVELATLLIEKNDLHSAFGVVSGLNHPAIARLHHDIFSPTFLFFDRLTTLIRFFDAESTVDYMEYVTNIPKDDASPVVPLLHITVAEIRKLFHTHPTLYRVPEGGRFTDMTTVTGNLHQQAEGASIRPEMTRSNVVVHWRKFQVLASLLDEVTAMQEKQMPHDVLHTVIDALHKIEEEQRRGTAIKHTTGAAATILHVAQSLEHRQWRAMELFDMNRLVNISFAVLPREASNE